MGADKAKEPSLLMKRPEPQFRVVTASTVSPPERVSVVPAQSIGNQAVQRLFQPKRIVNSSLMTVQRAGAAMPPITDAVATAVQSPGPGQPLPSPTLNRIEPYLGADLSGVRIHADSAAGRAANSLQARAFTHGNDIFLGKNESPSDIGLMAHEATHVIQQRGGAITRTQAQSSMGAPGDALEREADAVADKVTAEERVSGIGKLMGVLPAIQRYPGEGIADDIGSAVVSAGEAVVSVGETVGEAVVSAGETVAEAAVSAGEAVAGIAAEVWDTAQALARAVGGVVSFSGRRLVITAPSLYVCPRIPLQFRLGEIGKNLNFFEGVLPIAGVVSLYGAVGLHVGLIPEISAQLGPCLLHDVRIIIDPLTLSFNARGALTVNTAIGLGGELRAGLSGEVGLLLAWPDPPLLIQIPVANVQAGLAGFGRGIAATQLTISGSLAYSGGSFSLSASRDDPLGLGLDLGLAGYGALKLLGKNLCTLYWPLWEWHGDVAISSGLGINLSLGTGGVSASVDLREPQINQLPFDQLPLGLTRNMFTDDCPLCDTLYALGLMPSQRGGLWTGHPGPPWPGPLFVYPRNPGIPSKSLCRGACGPNCDTCAPEDKVVCENLEDGTTFVWIYPNYVVCGTHQGCRDHDACYDWCADDGETGIIGPCLRLCDFEVACTYGVKQGVGWIGGGPPHDGEMSFSDEPQKFGPFPEACPPAGVVPILPPVTPVIPSLPGILGEPGCLPKLGFLFRPMKRTGNLPVIEQSARGLGVRVPADIEPKGGQVFPEKGRGMSATPDNPQDLPTHRRPEACGGDGKDSLFAIERSTIDSAPGLQFDQDKPTHGVIQPNAQMHIDAYRDRLAETQRLWVLVLVGKN
jgi:hypothetical protein